MIVKLNKYKIFLEGKVSKSDKVDIYRDDNYIVIRPLTHKASCKYGAYTSWCISVPGDEYIFNNNIQDCCVIFIIQRNYKISKEKQLLINELRELNSEVLYETPTDQNLERYYKLLSDEEALDLSKIALIFGKNKILQSIWDKNNIDITHTFNKNLYQLPIDNNVIEKIIDYIDSDWVYG